MAGLAAAWELSSGDWRERLGVDHASTSGAGGSAARAPAAAAAHGRIEEHGLHLLLGCYDATFRVLRQVYGELDRATTDPDCPDPDVAGGAVVPTGDVGLAERTTGGLDVVRDPVLRQRRACRASPEPRTASLTPLDVATRGLRLLADFLRHWPSRGGGSSSARRRPPARRRRRRTLLRGAAWPLWPRCWRGPSARHGWPRAGLHGRPRRPGPGGRTALLARRAPRRPDGRSGDAPHLAAGRPGGHRACRAWRPTGCSPGRARSASTTWLPGVARPARRGGATRWTHRSCGACTT